MITLNFNSSCLQTSFRACLQFGGGRGDAFISTAAPRSCLGNQSSLGGCPDWISNWVKQHALVGTAPEDFPGSLPSGSCLLALVEPWKPGPADWWVVHYQAVSVGQPILCVEGGQKTFIHSSHTRHLKNITQFCWQFPQYLCRQKLMLPMKVLPSSAVIFVCFFTLRARCWSVLKFSVDPLFTSEKPSSWGVNLHF